MNKRGIWVACMVLLLFLPMLGAVEDSEVLEEGASEGTELKNVPNEVLQKEVEIPEGLQIFARGFLGVREGEHIRTEGLIVMLGLLVIAFLLIYNFLEIFPLFGGKKAITLILSFCVAVLLGISGGFKEGAFFLLGLGDTLALFSNQRMLNVAFVIVCVAVVAFFVMKGFHILKDRVENEEMIQAGREVRKARTLGKALDTFSS